MLITVAKRLTFLVSNIDDGYLRVLITGCEMGIRPMERELLEYPWRLLSLGNTFGVRVNIEFKKISKSTMEDIEISIDNI